MEDSQKIISPRFRDELVKFFSDHPARRLSQNLRRMLLDYLMDQLETGIPDDLDHLLWDVYYLFELLDVAAIETKGWQIKKDFKEEDVYEEGEKQEDKTDVTTAPAATGSYTSNAAGDKSNGITAVINFIVAAIQPEKIFLISPKPENNEKATYIDLLVVIEDTSQTSFKEYETLIRLGCIKYSEVNFSIHQSNVIARQMEEGHIFYSLACTKANLVYGNGKVPLAHAPIDKSAAIKEKAIHEFTTAFTRAQSFLANAEHLIKNNEKELAAFMLHQGAELTFRAIAMSLLGNNAQTHSLVVLKKLCRRCAPKLTDVLPANNLYEQGLLKLLDNAYLNARYADAYQIDEKDLTTLVERVTQLHATAKDVFDEKMMLL